VVKVALAALRRYTVAAAFEYGTMSLTAKVLCVSVCLLSAVQCSLSPTNGYNFAALQDCDYSVPLGMISGDIQDWQLSASSSYPQEWDKNCHERFARVYQPNGRGWCARYKTSSEWLQVDLGVAAKITGVLTQGRGDGQEWVTSFMLSYSMDAFHWKYITDLYGNQRMFEGNTDSYAIKHSYFDEPIIARFIKFHTVEWSKHPSMRVEIIGCQVCKSILTLPPFTKITASSERTYKQGGSCRAEDAFIIANKAWCAKDNNVNQWLQFDIGPPTLVTGLITKGRGDTGKKHWVTRYRLSYSNDSQVWYYYKDASHLDPKIADWPVSSPVWNKPPITANRINIGWLEFGGNVDKDLERYHYLNSPFIARYIRFHPIEWSRHISMRAGIIGCPYKGKCTAGYMRVSDSTPCVENLSFKKQSWINNRRQHKRHIGTEWQHGHAARAVDGDTDRTLQSCIALDNFYVEQPILKIDLGHRTQVTGLVIVTWQGKGQADTRLNYRDYMSNLEKLDVYIDTINTDKEQISLEANNLCGSVTRLNDALFQPVLHIQCSHATKGRYIYIEASGVANRWTRLFSAVICEVMVYQ
jgi:lactadherin